jgi:hypothetical protein
MASWSAKRKFAYSFTFILVLFIAIVALFFLFLYEKPNCFDGKQNGNEEGIDCGGDCALVCFATAESLELIWARAFQVTPGNYNLAAYVANPNQDATAKKVPYVFKVFDERNTLIYERRGEINIPKRSSFVIFEPSVSVGLREARYTFFEFEKEPVWNLATGEEELEKYLKVRSQTLTRDSSPAKFEAVMENTSIKQLNNVEVVVLLYDGEGNAVASSRTIIDRIGPEGEAVAIFTWPSLPQSVSRFEIVPRLR